MLSDGFSILNHYKDALLVLALTTFGLGLFVVWRMRLEKFASGIGLLACFGFGTLALVVFSYFLAVLAEFWPSILIPGSYLPVFLAVITIAIQIFRSRSGFRFDPFSLLVIIVILALLLVRLSFLNHLIVPPYSDSPVHYQAVSDILGQTDGVDVKISLPNIHKYYYHFGFHALAAWLASVSGIAPLDAISLLGQLFLVIGPLSVFALALSLTGNLPGALLAGLMAAIGWPMPAFAVNWGKYPALTALAVAPAALAVLPVWQRRKFEWQPFLLLLGLFLGTVLLHTRTIFILGLAIAVFVLAGKLTQGNKPGIYQVLLRALALGLFLWGFLAFFGESYDVLPLWILLLALTPFGVWASPRLMVAALAFISGIWLQTLLPLPGGQTLLDRPFVEILLVVPFSLWGCAGFAGLLQKIGNRQFLRIVAGLASCSLLLAVFLARGAYLPDPCCNYFTAQDAQAFKWIRANKTPQTLFVIPVFTDGRQRFGTDAGIWIYPLTGIGTNMLAYDTDWAARKTLDQLCQAGAPQTYLYVGGTNFGFPAEELRKQDWLSVVFQANSVQIYQVTGCP